jgi:hypothetical protein
MHSGKKVYVYLPGSVVSGQVEKRLETIEIMLQSSYDEFEQACHQLAVFARRRIVVSYFQNECAMDVEWHCPSRDPYGFASNG